MAPRRPRGTITANARPQDLLRSMIRLSAKAPITTGLEQALSRDGRGSGWEGRQKQHLIGWLSEYGGPGYYGRADWKRSAEFVYNHFNCAPGIVWLAEAAGAPRWVLLKARRAVLAAGSAKSAMSAAARRVLPWTLVVGLLAAGEAQDG